MAADSTKQSALVVNYLPGEMARNHVFPEENFVAYLKKINIRNYEIQVIENQHMAYLTLLDNEAKKLQKKLLEEKNYSIRELSPKTDYEKLKSDVDLVQSSMVAILGFALLIFERIGLMPSILLLSGQLIYVGIALFTFILLGLISAHYIKQIRENKRIGLNYMVLFVIWTGWLFSVLMLLQPTLFLSIGLAPFFSLPIITMGFFEIGNYLDESQINQMLKRWCDIVNVKISNLTSQSIFKFNAEMADLGIIQLEEIKKNDVIAIKAGAIIPVNGKLCADPKKASGMNERWLVDEAVVTGESVAAQKKIGDPLISASLNTSDKMLYLKADEDGSKSGLYKQIHKLEQFIPDKDVAGGINEADHASFLFIAMQMTAIAITALLWSLFGPAPVIPYVLVQCICVLVCACPCSLALAQLLPIYTSRTFLSDQNILIKDDATFRRVNKINVMVFDKTGTLTDPSKMKVDDFKIKGSSMSEEEIIQLVASLEYSHARKNDYAKSICAYALKRKIKPKLIVSEEKNNELSAGIRGIVAGRDVAIGPKEFIEKIIKVSPATDEFSGRDTGSFIAIDGQCVGWISFVSEVRKDALITIEKLKKQKIIVWMLTGDNEVIAGKIAKELNIENMMAKMNPHGDRGKKEFIEKLKSQGCCVGMVGDGLNDAPAFAAADVSFSITPQAAAAGVEDITLRGKLSDVCSIIEMARITGTKVRINVGILLLVNIIAILIAAGVLYPLLGFILVPTVVSIIGTLLSGIAVAVTWINRKKLMSYLRDEFLNNESTALLPRNLSEVPKSAVELQQHLRKEEKPRVILSYQRNKSTASISKAPLRVV